MAGVVVALVVALGWSLLAIVLGPRLGFVDRPDGELKTHAKAAVPLGGIGVFLGVHAAMAVDGLFDWGLVLATGVFLLVGLADDRWGLAPLLRVTVEVAGAVLLVVMPANGWSAGPPALVVGVVLTVGLVNAVNLFDGLDGLVGLSAAVTALGLAALAWDRGFNETFGLVLAAALVGFLVLNWHPARVFLGDNGSYVVGAFIAYGMLLISPEPVDSRIAVAAVMMGVFGLDMVTAIVRRRLAGKPLFVGDRSHIYDQLHDRGLSIPRVAITMALVQVVFVAVAFGVEQVRLGPIRLLLVAVAAAASLALVWSTGFVRPTSDA